MSWLHQWFRRPSTTTRKPSRRPAARRLGLDVLEERCTPAVAAGLSSGTLYIFDLASSGAGRVSISETSQGTILVGNVSYGASSYQAASVSKIVVHGNGQDLVDYRSHNYTPGYQVLTAT
jgi:hypothetical protein